MPYKYFSTKEWSNYLDRSLTALSWIYDIEMKFKGSSVFVEIQNMYYIITAEHVIDDAKSISIPVFYNEEKHDTEAVKVWQKKLVQNKNYWYSKEYDIALILVHNLPYKGINPIKITDFVIDYNKNDWLHYCGFTRSHVQKIRNKEKSVLLGISTIKKLVFYPFHVLQPIKEVDNIHIIGEYSNKLPQYNERLKEMIPAKLPSPKGLSGSAVWQFKMDAANENPKVIGIALEHDHSNQLITILKSEIIIKFLNEKLDLTVDSI